MQFCWRPLAPREVDHEFVWLSVSLGVAALLLGWFAWQLPTPLCFFHELTGRPCLTCGATRCALNFLRGNFAQALSFNPLAFAALCALVVFDLYGAIVFFARLPRLRVARCSPAGARIFRIAIVSALAANWIYLLGAGKV